MSKRLMETQGGEERFGARADQGNEVIERPQQATAAQMARRQLAQPKRRGGSARSSRQPSPAVANFAQPQTFQPPPSANAFNFSFGSSATPSFGAQPTPNGSSSFTFGASQQEAQPNGNNMFNNNSNNNPSFGSPFGAGNTNGANNVPQQPGGLNPASSSVFGQSNNGATTPGTSFSFGQSQQTPIANGFGANGANSFSGFSSQPNGAAKSTFSFGASQAEPARETTPSIIFGAASQSDQSRETTPAFPSFGAPKQNEPAQSTPAFGAFGQPQAQKEPEKKTGLFGASMGSESTPAKPGESVFSNLSAKKPNGFSSNMFTSSQANGDQTPKAKTPFSFGQQPSQPSNPVTTFSSQASGPTQTPASTSTGFIFQSGTNANGTGETPKPSNLFAQAGQVQQKAGAEDMSMTTPEATPKKAAETPAARNMFASTTSAPPQRSLFASQESSNTPSATPASSVPPVTNMFAQQSQESTTETPKPASLFSRMEFPASVPKPSSSLFAPASSTTASTPSLSAPSAQTNTLAPAPPAIAQPSPAAAAAPEATTSNHGLTKLIDLNEAVLAHLKKSNPSKDWTPIFTYYIEQAKELMKTDSSGVGVPSANTATAPARADPNPASASNLFKPQTPSTSLFAPRNANPPATAPPKRQAASDDEPSQPVPVTEKRAKANESVQYPKLPDGASNTAKLFASTLNPPASQSAPSAFKPSTASLFSAPSSTATQPANAEAAKPASFGFTPTLSSASSAAPSGFAPKLGSSAGAAGNAFAAFGAKATANADKEKKKRKDNEYDSEEDDEATWEAKDKERQAEAEKKIKEAASAGGGFVFKPSTASSSTSSKSIFSVAPTSTSETPLKAASLFSSSAAADKTTGEKQQGPGDHTFNHSTPVKFGASITNFGSTTPSAPPPSLGKSLFSATPSTTSSGNEAGKLAPPSFSFGLNKDVSAQDSRNTTPGVTTDGEASNGGEGENGPSDDQNDKQIDDMAELLPEEKAAHDVLFSTASAKTMKLEDKPSDSGARSQGWVEKGKGPLYVLRDKASGKVRVLQKLRPLGRQAMNFSPMALGSDFKIPANRPKMVQGTFVDHLANQTKPSTWMMSVNDSDEAKEVLRILNEARGK